MKKPMLNAIQKARMSTAMASKKPKLNPGFDSLPKEVQMKILKSKKPKMAMKKPKLGGMKKTMMAMKTAKPKLVMKKPAFTKRGDKIKTYNISGYVSKHTGLKPGSYERAVIMNGVRNAAPSRRKKIMELLRTNAGTADMFKTKKPKMAMKKKPMLSEKKVARKKKAIDRKKKMIVNAANEIISGKRNTPRKVKRALKDASRKQRAIYRKQKKINDFSQ